MLLEQVAGVGLVAGEVQEKGIKRLGVLVVEPFDFGLAPHVALMTRLPGNLSSEIKAG